MKGGLAVMVELAHWAAEAELAYDLALLFFPREELGPAENPLPASSSAPLVDEAQLVDLPRAHRQHTPARLPREPERSRHVRGPLCALGATWLGVNSIALALDGCRIYCVPAARRRRRRPRLPRGHVGHADPGWIASNVIPARTEAIVNFRYAPDRSPEDAESAIEELVVARGRSARELARSARAWRFAGVEALRRAGGFEVQPKQAWTNVADFAARGLDAVNLGPGATRYAHAVDERVEISELVRTYEALQSFLAGSV